MLAKAERLPAVACRYTEAEALLMTIEAAQRGAGGDADMVAEQRAKLLRLLSTTTDPSERRRLQRALEASGRRHTTMQPGTMELLTARSR